MSALNDPTMLLHNPEAAAAMLELLFTIHQIDLDMSQREKERITSVTSSLLSMRMPQSGTDVGSKAIDEERFAQDQAKKLYDALELFSAGPSQSPSLKMSIGQVYDKEKLAFSLGCAVREQAIRDDHVAATAMYNGRDLPSLTRCQTSVQAWGFAGIVGDEDDKKIDVGSAEGCERVIWPLIKRWDIDANREQFAWKNDETILDKTSCQVLLEHPLFKTLFDDMKASYYKFSRRLSNWSSRRSSNGKLIGDAARRVDCVGCCDNVLSLDCLLAGCDHYFCEGCVVMLASICVKDESSFPMKCCKQPIKPADVHPFLDDNLKALYKAACVEFGTPAEHRVYCPQPKCSAFLGSAAYSSTPGAQHTMTCQSCSVAVCVACKERDHPGENCEENKEMKATRKLAEEKMWMGCPKCHAIVEKTDGCNHIVCRCTEEFCYKCGVLWRPRTCTC